MCDQFSACLFKLSDVSMLACMSLWSPGNSSCILRQFKIKVNDVKSTFVLVSLMVDNQTYTTGTITKARGQAMYERLESKFNYIDPNKQILISYIQFHA